MFPLTRYVPEHQDHRPANSGAPPQGGAVPNPPNPLGFGAEWVGLRAAVAGLTLVGGAISLAAISGVIGRRTTEAGRAVSS